MSGLQLLKVCNHPNVVKYITAYTNDKIPDHIFIVTQPWADMNLADFLGTEHSPGKSATCIWWESKSPFDRCWHLFLPLIDGLACLHYNSIFHKDVKPENILLLGDRPILTDFGVSKLFRPRGQTKFTNSTYDYLAPEQISHETSMPQADVFAMGCCFLRVLSVGVGGTPRLKDVNEIFYKEDTSCQYGDPKTIARLMAMLQDQMQMLSEEELKSSPWQMVSLITFVRDMLVQDPSRRPTSGRLLALSQHIYNAKMRPSFFDHPRHLKWDALMPASEFLNPNVCVTNSISSKPKETEEGDSWIIPLLISRNDGSEIGVSLDGSLDTGSSVNLISAGLVEKLVENGFKLEYQSVDTELQTFTEGTVHIDRSVTLRVHANGHNMSISCLVLDEAEAYFDVLLGRDTTAALGGPRRLSWFLDRD